MFKLRVWACQSWLYFSSLSNGGKVAWIRCIYDKSILTIKSKHPIHSIGPLASASNSSLVKLVRAGSDASWHFWGSAHWGHTTKWIPTQLILIVVLLKITTLCSFYKFLEAIDVGLVECKLHFCAAWHQSCEIITFVRPYVSGLCACRCSSA